MCRLLRATLRGRDDRLREGAATQTSNTSPLTVPNLLDTAIQGNRILVSEWLDRSLIKFNRSVSLSRHVLLLILDSRT